MGNSYKNTSIGGSGSDTSGAKYLSIKENVDPKPPVGASNSYEMIRKKIDAADTRAIGANHYTREKMANK